MAMGTRTRGGMAAAALLLALAGGGCMSNHKAVVVAPEPTCEEALATGVEGFSDHEVARFLDSALSEDRTSGCWSPLMEACLNQNREIPHRHLAEAVKVFNKRRYEKLFHKAVYRYLADIAKGEAPYRPEDRLLLESYCSLLINSAHTAQDRNLGQAQVLCRQLDAGLYSRFFE
jgi:hypothetical protein